MARSLVFSLGESDQILGVVNDEREALSVRIGRGGECELPLPDGVEDGWTVSRAHARLFKIGGDYWIEDLHSKNLTYLDGRVVLSPTRIAIPCELRLGNVTVRVEQRELDAEHFEKCFPPFPTSDGLPATRGLDQLGLLDDKSQRVLAQVREKLHWTGAVQHVAEVLSGSRRAEEAELRMQQGLQVYLRAKKAHLIRSVRSDDISKELSNAGIKLDAVTLAKKIKSALARSPGDTSALRFRDKESQVLVWCARRADASTDMTSLIVADLSKDDRKASETDEADRMVRLVLGIANPFIDALQELEMRRATTRSTVSHKPSAEMLAACHDAEFWGVSLEITRAIYEAERGARSYLKQSDRRLPVIFFLGESGVGKSTLARLIHRFSDHANGPFIEVNCATIPENLAESELFGHEKGAFTGADRRRSGLFETAIDGMLFLDEVGTMNPGVQSNLLTVLDTGTFRRAGGSEPLRTNCYVILATNEDPEELCRQGKLRKDLWYRIQTLTIPIPPLRERKDDIGELVQRKTEALNRTLSPSKPKRVSEAVLRLFEGYSWPGNARELTESLEAAFRLTPTDKPIIEASDLPSRLHKALGIATDADASERFGINIAASLDENVRRLEREYLARLIHECEGVKTRVAERANVSHQTVYNKLAEFRAWLNSPEGKTSATEIAKLQSLAGPYWNVIAT